MEKAGKMKQIVTDYHAEKYWEESWHEAVPVQDCMYVVNVYCS